MSLREALQRRETMAELGSICGQCNLRQRYRPRELARVAVSYARARLAA